MKRSSAKTSLTDCDPSSSTASASTCSAPPLKALKITSPLDLQVAKVPRSALHQALSAPLSKEEEIKDQKKKKLNASLASFFAPKKGRAF